MNISPRALLATIMNVFYRLYYHPGLGHHPGLGPLTTRSVVIMLFILYLLLGPVSSSTDIIAAALAYGLLALIGIFTTIIVAQGALLQRSLALEVVAPSGESYVGSPARVAIIISPTWVLPLTYLDISLKSPHADLPRSAIRVTGTGRSERRLVLELPMPHRGNWDISGVQLELRDVVGLSRFIWQEELSASIIVTPPVMHETNLPLVSSTQRPGDMVTDMLNRQGDPFDIKAYHPSDGIKKIIWKTFAKRGELLSRHPEASMTPEGFVVMLVLARPEDDQVCARALAYAISLKELKLDIVMSCEGARGRTPASEIARCKELLIDSVWDAKALNGSSIQLDATELLDLCCNQMLGIRVRKLIIFCSGARTADPLAGAQILQLATWLSTQGIEPIFCLTPPSTLINSTQRPIMQRLGTLFVAGETTKTAPVVAANYQRFLADCLSRQWEVHL